ncbi:MAG: hypothetical protein KGH84_03945 [Paracoccaceae bacterium]|nr:hypothetical protein [Paracoccaceae bacterium]
MRSAVIARKKDAQRERWWYLHQEDDDSLWVSYDDDDPDSVGWTKPLYEVLASGPESAKMQLESWIGSRLAKEDSSTAGHEEMGRPVS